MKNKIRLIEQKKLLKWFEKESRHFPWRGTRDPYAIWISEVMLQQTTTQAVIPYYKKFLKVFPNINTLAQATQESIYTLWAGLGYYQRARNLMQAAKEIKALGYFPSSYKELLRLPGFGPYTARAVSSIAFSEPVGILDGNVIRFLSRFHGLPIKWWTASGRQYMQNLTDKWVFKQESSQINQALMEIGALICSSQRPSCLLCPLKVSCVAFKNHIQNQLPLKRAKRKTEMFHWKPLIIKHKNQFALAPNTILPFLKGRLIFPGTIRKLDMPPHHFHFQHSITHHKIYVTVQFASPQKTRQLKKNLPIKTIKWHHLVWLDLQSIIERTPYSLIQKTIECMVQNAAKTGPL